MSFGLIKPCLNECLVWRSQITCVNLERRVVQKYLAPFSNYACFPPLAIVTTTCIHIQTALGITTEGMTTLHIIEYARCFILKFISFDLIEFNLHSIMRMVF